MITGADVLAYRKRRGLSRKELATVAGLTEGKVWRIEQRNVIHADELQILTTMGVMPVTMPAETPTPTVTSESPVLVVGPPDIPPSRVVPLPIVEEPLPDVNLAELAARPTYDRYVSNSEVQAFKRCRRKWWLSWHRGLTLKHESPVGVRQVGNRVHRALKHHYVPGGPTQPEAMLAALEREILLDRSALPDNTLDDVRMQFEKEADLERVILEGYLEWLQTTGADSELEVIAPETYLEAHLFDFGAMSVAIIGKLDVRVKRTTDAASMFIDHKVVGEFTTPARLLPMDEQMKHYHLLESKNAGGQHTAGAIYNMLRRVKRTGRATPPFYQRVDVFHNRYELEDYERRLRGVIGDIIDLEDDLNTGASPAQRAYPSPRRECSYDCPFFAVCPMFDDGSRAEDMLASLYEPHDPLEYYLTEVIGETE